MDRWMYIGLAVVVIAFGVVFLMQASFLLFAASPGLFFLPKRARAVSVCVAGVFFDLFSGHAFGIGILAAVLFIVAARILDVYRSLNVYLFGLGVLVVSFGIVILFSLFRLPSIFLFSGGRAALDALVWQVADLRMILAILFGAVFAMLYARRQATRDRSAFFSL